MPGRHVTSPPRTPRAQSLGSWVDSGRGGAVARSPGRGPGGGVGCGPRDGCSGQLCESREIGTSNAYHRVHRVKGVHRVLDCTLRISAEPWLPTILMGGLRGVGGRLTSLQRLNLGSGDGSGRPVYPPRSPRRIGGRLSTGKDGISKATGGTVLASPQPDGGTEGGCAPPMKTKFRSSLAPPP